MSVAITPISSETPIPWSESEKTSRPNWSVPKGWLRLRPLSTAPVSSLWGLCGERPSSLTSAPSSTRPTSTRPMRPLRLRQSACRSPGPGSRKRGGPGVPRPGCIAASCSGPTRLTTSACPRPRIDEHAGGVHEHVDDHEPRREEHRHALHDREVAVVDRGDEQTAEAREHVDLL